MRVRAIVNMFKCSLELALIDVYISLNAIH
jgi:hypothetical protein